MPEPAVWICFGNCYSKKLKPCNKALSSKVANLNPLTPEDFWKMDSTANVFWGNFLELFINICAVEIYLLSIKCELF